MTRSGWLLGAALLLSSAQAASYTLPVNLNKVTNPALLKGSKDLDLRAVNAAQRSALSKNGFVIVPAGWRQFDAAYEATRYAEQPIFVTSDSMLHVYHLVFDKLLRDLERESLEPATRRMTALLVADAAKQYASLKGTPLEKDALSALAYLAVAQKLADPAASAPAEVRSLVEAELRLIDAHAGLSVSPIFQASGLQEDYSQYVPRGHYTRSEALKRYFRSMMWLGHINLRVKNDSETRTAALVTNLIARNTEVQKLWARVYDPTALLVGKSDDLDYRQYAALLKQVTGGNVLALAEATTLKAFQTALQKLPPPKVNSVFVTVNPGEGGDVKARERDTLGFRLMGQRFTLDGAAFQMLIYRSVGTADRPRALPRGLDLLAGLGSDTALNILKDMGEDRYPNYLTQMTKVRANFAALKASDWNANVYSGWIYALGALAKPEVRDERYPAFMRTPAWARKELLTALGSWTELRHDTILYAKQTMAEMGSGEEPEHPRGYVEPNALLWTRLLNLESLTRKVLKDQGILSERTKNNLDELHSTLSFLNRITALELSAKPISRDDYDRIHYYGGWLEQMKIASADPQGNGEGASEFNENDMAAVVADVATGVSASGELSVLEEGTGFIDELYVVVPNGKGGVQVARGGVYSQYEFVVPPSGRLTDEAWRKQLSSGAVPPAHPWLSGIRVK